MNRPMLAFHGAAMQAAFVAAAVKPGARYRFVRMVLRAADKIKVPA